MTEVIVFHHAPSVWLVYTENEQMPVYTSMNKWGALRFARDISDPRGGIIHIIEPARSGALGGPEENVPPDQTGAIVSPYL